MKWRENIAMKALAFIAAVAAFTATAIMAWYQLANLEALWGSDYSYVEGRGYTQNYLIRQDSYTVKVLVGIYEHQASGQELVYADKRTMEQYEAELDASATNLRWQLLDQDGKIIYGNTEEDCAKVDVDYWEDYTRNQTAWPTVHIGEEYWDHVPTSIINWRDYDGLCSSDLWQDRLPDLVQMAREYDDMETGAVMGYHMVDWPESAELTVNTMLTNDDGRTVVLRVETSDGLYLYAPTVQACLEANQFGYIFDADTLEWKLSADAVETAGTAKETVSLVMWVDPLLRVDDQYRRADLKLEQWQASRVEYLTATLILGTLGVLLMIYLCCSAGHKRGVDGIYLNWFHRIPGDVLLCAMFLAGFACVVLGVDATLSAYAYMYAPMYIQLLFVGLAVCATAALGMGALITVCARCKARTLLRNTLTWMFCAWCWYKLCQLIAAMGRISQALPLVWKAVLGCMAYTLFTIVTIENGIANGLWLIVTVLAGLYLCLWAYQWKKIRHGTQEIIRGNPSYHIDTQRMLPDLRGHANELNNLGHAISTAVDERMKSERFKAELITNVSHDLKTPLTSIINYVDLLKKVEIADPKAAEYIEVLDRKSQRLKKLTEDLVEASKASTGSLTVNWERLDFKQLADQALAECGDRLEAQGLTVVRTLPEEPVWVDADGRHLWRVLDNLLTNCAKYALPGTRVYVDLRESGGMAVLSVKNISREALDIPAERLMERFVRGDESRNASGSGLGLSIAQSLTELQHGRFDISIDGDLFKAIVTLPLVGEDENGLPILRL
ncbi:MAG: hypothetical protein HDT38_00165 [Clostridiales bacterium]|nr:hypothetical protein [Clostridiales bacterium]